MNLQDVKLRKPLADFLRDSREKSKLSQIELAEIMQCKPQFVSNWERGMSTPPLHMVKLMCKVCRVGEEEMLAQLLGFEERKIRFGLKLVPRGSK